MSKITMKAARVNAGYTQEAMAEKLGVSRPFYNKMETGDTPIRSAYLYAFCHIVGFNEDEIVVPEKSTKSEHGEE